MNNKWPIVRLSEILDHRKEFITIDDLTEYVRPRVQLHVKGIVLRDKVLGAQIKTKTQQVCHAGEFLVAEIDAKVGGFGIVPELLDGSIVSSHYFLFVLNTTKIDKRFLEFYICTPAFRDQVAAQGSTNYAAVRPSHVLGYEIPLPPLSEQRRIVARIGELAAQIAEAKGLRHEAFNLAESLMLTTIENIFVATGIRFGKEPLGNYVKLQGGYAFKSDEYVDSGLPIVRITNLENETVHTSGSPCMLPEQLGEFTRFVLSPDDILIAMTGATTGKLGIVPDRCKNWLLNQRVGRFIPNNSAQLESKYVYWLARGVQKVVFEKAYGGAQPNISPSDIEALTFPFPPISEQRRIIAELDILQTEVEEMKKMQEETSKELDALLPSILDKAFRGEL